VKTICIVAIAVGCSVIATIGVLVAIELGATYIAVSEYEKAVEEYDRKVRLADWFSRNIRTDLGTKLGDCRLNVEEFQTCVGIIQSQMFEKAKELSFGNNFSEEEVIWVIDEYSRFAFGYESDYFP